MLKRILLCGAHRSASIPNPSLNPSRLTFRLASVVVILLLTVGAAAQGGGCTNGSACELRWPSSEGGSGVTFTYAPNSAAVQSAVASGGALDALITSLPPGAQLVTVTVNLPSSPNFNLGSDAGPITLVSPNQLPGGGGGEDWFSGWRPDTPASPAQAARMRQQFNAIWSPGPLAKWGWAGGYAFQVVGGLMNLACGEIGCGLIAGEGGSGGYQFAEKDEILLGEANALAKRKFGFSFDELNQLPEEQQISVLKGNNMGLVGTVKYNQFVDQLRRVEDFGEKANAGKLLVDVEQEELHASALLDLSKARVGMREWFKVTLKAHIVGDLPNTTVH
jgi:hypothetical protein